MTTDSISSRSSYLILARPHTQRSRLPQLSFVLRVLGAQGVSGPETVRHNPGVVLRGGGRAAGLEVRLDTVVDDAVVVAGGLCVVAWEPVLVRPAGSEQ